MTESLTVAPTAVRGKVLEFPPVEAELAAAHFTHKLRCETDPADVWVDMRRGIDTFVLVDVRSHALYRERHIPGAISLPVAEITPESIRVLPPGTMAVTYCAGPGCNGSTKGARKLAALGVPVKEMIGGIEYWEREGYPTE
jgi:rhodanese-related sulfurtransferase